MSLITILSRIENGANRSLDISSNTLVTLSVTVGGSGGTDLTKTILDGLIAHAASTSNPHSVTKAQVGLGNVDDVQQLPMSYLDTDNTLAADSDAKVASQKAVKAYVDGHAGAAASALDGTFVIKNTADNTKRIAFDASNIATSSISTIVVPDGNVDLGALTDSNIDAAAAIAESKLALDYSTSSLNTAIGGKVAKAGDTMSGNLAMGGNKVTGLGAPAVNGDALRYDQLGANNGIATLDGGGKIPVGQLPNSVMTYEGTFDASATPATPLLDGDSAANAGMVYLANVAGSYNFGAGAISFALGDWAVYNGTIWEKSTNSNAVVSVNGQTGVVTVNAINQLTGDVTTSAASGSQSLAATIATGAVTLAKMAADSVDENKIVSTTMSASGAITGGSGAKLAVAVDATTIEIATNALQVKDLGISTAKLAATSVTAAKLGSDVAGSGLSGGNGSALTVAFAPKLVSTETSINAISGVKALRYAVAADAGFVAGQMVVADNDATTADNFYVMGISSGSVSAGGAATLVRKGVITATAHGFTVGLPVFLGASGALTQTAPTAAASAVVRVAIARDANNLDVDIQLIGVN